MKCAESPCRDCWQVPCLQEECPRWQVWFFEKWEGVNRFAWEQMDLQSRREPEKFCYELPHMIRSPCLDCRCESWCDRPCHARLQWWDRQMGRMRRRLGGV